MASKWAKLRGKYAALPYDEALRQAADDLMDLEPGDLVERYNELDEEIDELNERVKGLTFARAAAERALITRMDAIGTDRLDMGGYSWSVTYAGQGSEGAAGVDGGPRTGPLDRESPDPQGAGEGRAGTGC
jgi:predicted Zn-dependent protease